MPRRTIYNIIKNYEGGLPCEDKPRQGRPAKLNKQQLQKLKDSAENHFGISHRKLEKEFKVSRPYIQRSLKKIGLKYYKRQRAPKYNQKITRINSSKVSKITPRIYRSRNFHPC